MVHADQDSGDIDYQRIQNNSEDDESHLVKKIDAGVFLSVSDDIHAPAGQVAGRVKKC